APAARPIRPRPATRGLAARATADALWRAARRRYREVAGLAPDAGAAGPARPASRAGPGDALAAARIVGRTRPRPHRPDLARDGQAVHGGRGAVEGLSPGPHALGG